MNESVSIEIISAKRAEELLETMPEKQRALRRPWVDVLASNMASGEFRLSNDAIVIASGQLINGQHRLRAVVQSKKPARFIVLTCQDESLYAIIDSGMKRSTADVLASEGVANGNNVAAAVAWVLAYDKGQIHQTMSSGAGSIRDRLLVLRYRAENPLIEKDVSDAVNIYRQSRLFAASMAGAFLHLAGRNGYRQCAWEFLNYVFNESNPATGPGRVLRGRLIATLKSKSRLPNGYIFGILIKAFNASVCGDDVRVLKLVDGERFPQLVLP